MATAAQKITLSPSRDIPFNKLVLSQSNVRRVKSGISVEELAEDIARRGTLLQSLNVRPVLDAEGAETGMYEVPAGGRRYQALAILVKQKRLGKTAPVPCVVRDPSTPILAEDDSLAENTQRVPLHPLDQFRAFFDMRSKGMTEEEIASAFFTTVQVVKQRLRLASVSSVLLDIYAEDGMKLEELMAFTVNPDHARQEQVWEAIQQSYNRQPWHIRQLLTETTVPAEDKRALFVGLDAYEQAGGPVLRDLFQQDQGGWLQDPALLDRLVSEKLKGIAEEIAAEGWKWITVDTDLPYGYDRGLRALAHTDVDLTDEERAAREALREEYDRLEAEYEGAEELPEEIDMRLGEIETELEAFEKLAVIYDPAEIGRAGVFISIDREGEAVIDRGYVRPEDEAPVEVEGEDGAVETGPDAIAAAAGTTGAVITIGGQSPEAEEDDEEEDVIKPLPERLVIELTSHRTLALREAVGANPRVAFTALLHKLVRDTFLRTSTSGASLQVSIREVHFRDQGKDLGDMPYAKSVDQRHEDWKADLPTDENALWDWLAVLDDASRQALLAHCVAYGINALYERPNPYSATGVSQAGLVLLAFFILAIQLFVTLIEFKLTTLAGFVLIPFGLFGKTAFMAERVLGNVISSGIKVLVLAVIIGIGSTLFSQFTAGFGGATPTIDDAMAIVLAALSLLGLGIFGPGIANGLVSGGPQLGAGAAVGTGLAVGGAALAAGGAAGLALRGGAAALSGGAAAIRGGAAAAGAASTAYNLGAMGQAGASGAASGLAGVGRAAGSAAISPLKRAAVRAAEGVKSSFSEGAKGGFSATGGSSTLGTIGGEAANDPAFDAAAAVPQSGPPDWAKRMKRNQHLSHGVSAAAHAIRSGDSHGGGSSVNLSESHRS